MRKKLTLRADFDSGEGSIGNIEAWRQEHSGLLRADILKDWLYELSIEYELAVSQIFDKSDQ